MVVISNKEEENRFIVLILVYISCIINQQEKDFSQLTIQVKLLTKAYQQEKTLNQALEFIVIEDFNQ